MRSTWEVTIIEIVSGVRYHRPENPRHVRLHAVGDRDGWLCRYCLKRLADLCEIPYTWDSRGFYVGGPTAGGLTYLDVGTLDHIIPTAFGGSSRLDNLVMACLSCNAKKGRRTVAQWLAATHLAGVAA